MKTLCFSIFTLLPITGWSQFTDNFSDNNFTVDPTWSGDDSKFVIDNFQLKLQAPVVASNAYLSTPSSAINNAVWEFTLKFDFNPSNSNYARIYLVSDQPNLAAPLNGYYILVGDTPDEVSLYKQTGTTSTKIIDGIDGTVNFTVVNVAVKVTRSDSGNWELFSDPGITGTFMSEGVTADNTFKASAYFGIYCLYTPTRSDKFYFDNFSVSGNPYVDLDPPTLQLVNVVSANKLIIQFNETIEVASSSNPANYEIGNNIGNPVNAILQSDQHSVELNFLKKFQNGLTQLLTLHGIKDVTGNAIAATSHSFLYFNPVPATRKSIIISEIFADPSPQVGLPDAEFIEVFNRSDDPFNLAGWTFTDGKSKAALPNKIILPGEYWAITSTSNVSKFGLTANVIGAPNFPTLNNSSDTLIIKTSNGILIDSISYDLSWYRNSDKQEGGWSLELIDPNNICGEDGNWTSSESEIGGTPGVANSVLANKPDLTGPHLTEVTVISPVKLLLSFNEKLEDTIAPIASFDFVPAINVKRYYFESKSLRSLFLELDSELVTKQLYTLTINNLFDCSGNEIEANTKIEFALPEVATAEDVVINEILFNPRPNGVDFVELYNRSDKYINVKGWTISNLVDEQIANPKSISPKDKIISPNDYFVLTSNSLTLKNNYPQGKENTFNQISMPSFPDEEGSVAITSDDSLLIDYFRYNKKFHSSLIKDDEGISLERISYLANSNDPANWLSASSISGFATPGYLNSSFRIQNEVADGQVSIVPRVFAPHSGIDFSQINFKFDEPGFAANVKIFDQQGRLIKTIANNETLGFEGFFRWDGDLDEGGKARAGYYFVWFEVFNANGTVKTFRERVVISAR